MTEFEQKPEEIIADVLSRYSVIDLREQSNEDLDAGEDKLYKATEPIKIVGQGEVNFIRFWKIESGGKNYEVRRFENFVFCSCLDFFFSKTCCKHITVTTRFYCSRCYRNQVTFGELCGACQIATAPYIKETVSKSKTLVGGIPV